MAKVCAIKSCNQETKGFYPLCEQHLKKIKTGEVVKNEEGQWIENDNHVNIKNNIDNLLEDIPINKNCVLCREATSNGYLYCKDCYYNIQDRMEELDKNQNPTKLKDYYYNAKDYAMRIYNEDKIYYQELTMVAITNLLNQLYDDDSLVERLHKDISLIEQNLKTKNNRLTTTIKETSKIDEIKVNNDKNKAKIKKAIL